MAESAGKIATLSSFLKWGDEKGWAFKPLVSLKKTNVKLHVPFTLIVPFSLCLTNEI